MSLSYNAGRLLRLGGVCIVLLLGVATVRAQEPVPIPPDDPARARSAEENITFGEIQSSQDKRLNVRDRIRQSTQGTPPPPRVVIPSQETPPGSPGDPPAVVDTNPTKPVHVGLVTRTTDPGLLVVEVKPESAADEAGVKLYDLIKRVPGRAALTPKDLDETLNRYLPLASVPLIVERDGEELHLTLVIPADHIPHVTQPPQTSRPQKGPQVDLPESKEVIRDAMLGWVLGERGETLVVVMTVLPNTPAFRAGLQPNDVLLGVDGQRFTEPEALSVAVHQRQAGEYAVLAVRRGTREGIVSLMIPGPQPAPAAQAPSLPR